MTPLRTAQSEFRQMTGEELFIRERQEAKQKFARRQKALALISIASKGKDWAELVADGHVFNMRSLEQLGWRAETARAMAKALAFDFATAEIDRFIERDRAAQADFQRKQSIDSVNETGENSSDEG